MRYLIMVTYMQLGDRKIKHSGYICPDCKTPLTRRTSEMCHLLMQKVYFACPNIDCGATFAGRTEIVCRLSPPRVESPDVSIPYSSHSEFYRSSTAEIKKKIKPPKVERELRTRAQSTKLRREKIARLLAAGDSFAAIQEKMSCSASMVLSVKVEVEKNTRTESGQ